MVKGKTIAFALLGGAAIAFLCFNGHYIVRYVWLNMGKQSMDDFTPLIPHFPDVREVDWMNINRPIGHTNSVRSLWGKRLLVLQSYTPNIAEYASISAQMTADYCKKKGYLYKAVVSKGPASRERNPCWDKVHYILQEFKNQDIAPAVAYTRVERKEPDTWIFWMDSDAVISDEGKYIEAIGNMDDKADIFICTSIPLTKNINTGAMLIRMTPWMHKFLTEWWAWSNDRWHQTMCHEQSALDEMISKDYMGIVSSGKLALFGPTEFNSTYQHGLEMKGKFIQHYRGCSTEKRRNAFIEIREGQGRVFGR